MICVPNLEKTPTSYLMPYAVEGINQNPRRIEKMMRFKAKKAKQRETDESCILTEALCCTERTDQLRRCRLLLVLPFNHDRHMQLRIESQMSPCGYTARGLQARACRVRQLEAPKFMTRKHRPQHSEGHCQLVRCFQFIQDLYLSKPNRYMCSECAVSSTRCRATA